MLEIFFLIYFVKKIKQITLDKGIGSGKWIALLLLSWFGAEATVFIIGILILGQEDNKTLLILMIPALLAAYFSATLVIKKLQAEDSNSELELDEFVKKNDDDLKHFR